MTSSVLRPRVQKCPPVRLKIVSEILTALLVEVSLQQREMFETRIANLKGIDLALFDWGMREAALKGHVEIVKLCKEWEANNATREAAEVGYIKTIKLCKERGARNFDEAMIEEAGSGHVEIVKLCKEWRATGFDEAMIEAAGSGNVEIVKLCGVWGATDFDDAMREAAWSCLLYTSPSPRDATLSRMPSSA